MRLVKHFLRMLRLSPEVSIILTTLSQTLRTVLSEPVC